MKDYLYIHPVCKIHKKPMQVSGSNGCSKVLKHTNCSCENNIHLDSMVGIEGTIINGYLHI